MRQSTIAHLLSCMLFSMRVGIPEPEQDGSRRTYSTCSKYEFKWLLLPDIFHYLPLHILDPSDRLSKSHLAQHRCLTKVGS